jgi:hypothetical protein
VALSAVGAVVLAPILTAAAPAIAQEASSALEPLTIRLGTTRHGEAQNFTRVEFAGVIGARSRVRREGQAVVVRIGTTAAPDVSLLKNSLPPGVTKVETRAVQGGSEVLLTLAQGADARSGVADGAVWLNLYAPGAQPQAGLTASSAVPANGVVPVTTTAEADRVVMSFQWAAPVGAAVFRRDDAVWIVFDTAAKMGLPKGAKWAPPEKRAGLKAPAIPPSASPPRRDCRFRRPGRARPGR